MKPIKYMLLFTITIILLLNARKHKSNPTQAVIDALNKSWTANSVTLDNSNVTRDWNGFNLTFNSTKGYTATSLSDESILVWPANGSYTFPDANNPHTVLRNDGVQISLTNITETSVTLTFVVPGRTKGLNGEWVFEMGS